jgi:hypothetical protein
LPLLDSLPDRTFYRYLTVVAAIGVGWSYGKVAVAEPSVILDAVTERTFNDVRASLEYGVGVHTLRYAAILTGGIALHNLVFRKTRGSLDFVNVLLLLGSAAIASRLALVMSLLIAVGLGLVRERLPSARHLVILGVVGVVGLTALNYVRNANYYEIVYGVSNPLVMSAYAAISYVGAPFQASVGVAGQEVNGHWSPVPGALAYAAPEGNTLENPSFELTTTGWEASSSVAALSPALSTASLPGIVETGLAGLQVSPIPRSRPHTDYVWSSSSTAPAARAGDRLLVRIYASGAASLSHPLRLGLRWPDGTVSTVGIAPVRNGLSKREDGDGWLLEGVFTAPRELSTVQLALYREVAEGTQQFAADSAVLAPVATADATPPSRERAALRYLAPTYAKATFDDVLDYEETYRSYVDIEANLTTNSVFTSMFQSLGWAAFGLIMVVAVAAATLAGHASRYASYFTLTALVIAYCFAELWRVYLFNAGIVHFLVIVLIAVPILDNAISRVRRRVDARRRAAAA